MSEVDVFANRETLGVFVGKNGGASGFRLTDHVNCTWVIQETIVDAARIPCVDPVRSPE